MTSVILDPALWESLEAGAQAYVEEWLVAEGDYVRAGQTLVRANLIHNRVDVPSSHSGVLEEIMVAAGETFAPGTALARLVST
jgi:pyruvate/2-oxoglutarate dehydrogenase complex dihydrolipoamide acyltransferase (E2) component